MTFPSTLSMLLVDRRAWIEEQRDQVLDLLLGGRRVITEARHLRAQVVGLGVVDLAVDVPLHLGTVAAQLAELVEARADRAEGGLPGPDLVAVVAAAAGDAGGVAPCQSAPALRDAFTRFPIAEELAIGREADRGQLILLQALGDFLGGGPLSAVADRLYPVLVDPIQGSDAARLEIALHRCDRFASSVGGLRGQRDGERERCGADEPCWKALHGVLLRRVTV